MIFRGYKSVSLQKRDCKQSGKSFQSFVIFSDNMSSRALRKLQQEKDELNSERLPSDDDVSIIRPPTGARAKLQNPFDLVSQFFQC